MSANSPEPLPSGPSLAEKIDALRTEIEGFAGSVAQINETVNEVFTLRSRVDDIDEVLKILKRKLAELAVLMGEVRPNVRNCPKCTRIVSYRATVCPVCRTDLRPEV